jgi:eukaryotic-like serine/threonine-protein kinase
MQLERYQIVRELGSGATAQVSLALDTNDRKLVALKRLHHIYALSGGARLRREFRALSSLNHPNIVRVYDHGEADGTPFLALEYVEGETLGDWLTQSHSLTEIAALFAEVADALEAAHMAGLIHRDLKPENIMVTKSGSAKLMDFGLTKLMAQQSLALTKIGAMVGTVLYMSPEQCRGLEIDARADLYALGAVLYRAVTGEPPFMGGSLTAVVLQHLSSPTPNPRAIRRDLPKPLEELIVQLLAKEPADRPRSAAEVARRLRGVFDEAPLEGAPVQPVSDVRLLRAPLIGREAQRTQLEVALGAPKSGFVALVGEAGIGKSRLLEALLQPLVTVRATAEDTEPFALISSLLRVLERQAPEILSRLSESERGALQGLEQPVNDAVVTAQRFEAFRQLLEMVSSSTIIALEDLQYADAGTLAMLAHGFRDAQQTRVVVTYRPEELRGGKPRLLPPAQETVALEGLEKKAMQQLLEARLGGAAEVGLRDALLERANGNPWALDELLREIIARSAIVEQSGVFEWDRQYSSRGLMDGTGLLSSAGQRLKHLAPDARMFAETAAVLGREFHFEDARALLGWDDDAALSALEVLLTGKVLLERPSGDEFAFAHPEYVRFLRAAQGGSL